MNQQQRLAQFKEDRPALTSQVEVTKPEPFANTEALWTRASRFAVIGIFLIAAIGGLYFARSFLMPVSAALIIGLTLSPIQKWAEHYRIPTVLTGMLLALLFFAGLWLAVALVASPLAEWVAKAPEFSDILKQKLRLLDSPIAVLRELQNTMTPPAASSGQKVAVETSLATITQQVLVFVTPAVSELVVFFGTLLFFLVGINRIRRQLIVYFGSREARLRTVRIWNDIEHNLVSYLATVSVINVCLGAVTALMLYALDFPNPIAFGVLAFVLNYAPYVGPATFIATLFVVGLVALPSLGSALLPPLLFLGMATVEGQFITPSVVGHRLTLSPFLIFLALAFWTWLWGPLGTFLATPLLIVALVLLNHLFPQDEHPLPG